MAFCRSLLELSVLAECSSLADENCSVSVRELKKGQKFLLCLLVDHIWSCFLEDAIERVSAKEGREGN